MLTEGEYDFATASRREKNPVHEQETENPVPNVPDNDRQPPTRLHLPGEAPGFPRVSGASLYCMSPECDRCGATKGLRAVRITKDDVDASGLSVRIPTGPQTLDGNCVDELRFRGFTVTTMSSEELAPEFLPEVPT